MDIRVWLALISGEQSAIDRIKILYCIYVYFENLLTSIETF